MRKIFEVTVFPYSISKYSKVFPNAIKHPDANNLFILRKFQKQLPVGIL